MPYRCQENSCIIVYIVGMNARPLSTSPCTASGSNRSTGASTADSHTSFILSCLVENLRFVMKCTIFGDTFSSRRQHRVWGRQWVHMQLWSMLLGSRLVLHRLHDLVFPLRLEPLCLQTDDVAYILDRCCTYTPELSFVWGFVGTPCPRASCRRLECGLLLATRR